MSTPFQNRLVGTIIVAAAAIIFLPDILDGEKKAFHQQFDEIPPQPKINIEGEIKAFPEAQVTDLTVQPVEEETAMDEQFELAQKESTDNGSEPASSVNGANKPDTNPIENKVPVENPVDTENVSAELVKTTTPSQLRKDVTHGSAWVIQLGSYRSKNNVEALVAKLRLNDYVAFTRPIQTRSGEMTKVYIGPEVDKAKLENAIEPLFALTKVKGKITKFETE